MTDSGGDGRDGVRTVRAGRRRMGIHRPGRVLLPGGGGAREPWTGLLSRGRALGPARRRLNALSGGGRTPARRPAGRTPKEAS
ncbi:hypothetical protein [Streptomyces sp. KMM 9044]|uniref:hypothetical protein n=1 Tax=Streptomyces sp. KMM 9044 TaxID=2744474 RepID=UPI0021516C3B|nr:hypothetical protein [Streptomyces sp. KMM 9044]WAX76900.1 hypothetical protein HUV60_003720 [Streptomyces sp. KMM 9044]